MDPLDNLTNDGNNEYLFFRNNGYNHQQALQRALAADASGIYAHLEDDVEDDSSSEEFIPQPIVKRRTGGALQTEIYCLKCKSRTKTDNVNRIKSKNGRSMIKGNCAICGTGKNKFV